MGRAGCIVGRSVIGHALALAPRPPAGGLGPRIALGFAVGSLCFFVGPFPGFVQLVGPGADGVVFFAGSVFFTLAAGLELRESTVRRGRRWAADSSWWSAAVQFAGTLFFNISTFAAMQDGLSTKQENRLVWSPDVFGSACFLISGAARLPRGHRTSPVAGPSAATATGRGGRQPGRLRPVRGFRDRVLRGAVERLGPRPGGLQLVHRARCAVLLDRRREDLSASPAGGTT